MIFMKFFRAQLTNNRSKDTGTDWLVVVVEDHGSIAIKTDRCAVFTTDFFAVRTTTALRTSPFFTRPRGMASFTETTMMSPHGRVTTVRTTQDLDALNTASAAVVSYIQIGLHLDHLVSSRPIGRAVTDFRPVPRVSIILVRAAYRATLPNAWFSTLGHIR